MLSVSFTEKVIIMCNNSFNVKIFFFIWSIAATEDDSAYVQRGCVDTNTPAVCTTGTSDECKTCEGNDCNAKIDFQTCHVCDDCTLIPTTGQTICEEYLAKCNVYIDNGRYSL